MRPDIDELISVIVPAYNAQRYIAETMASLLGQTHRNIEVVVVDDGSRDSTMRIVESFAVRDDRVRMFSQANGGVAQARNHALREARGRFVAPCDADDLWSPDKLRLQVAAWQAAEADIGLVYSAYAVIDAESHVHRLDPIPVHRGRVFNDLCRGNFIGNASSAMMRRDDVLAVGGFDPGLRAQGAQGCEDLKLYLQIAATQAVELVPSRCIGYRQTRDNMSSDIFQMLRSFEAVAAEISAAHPDVRRVFDDGEIWLMQWLRNRALESGRYGQAGRMFLDMLPRNATLALKTVYWDFLSPAIRSARRKMAGWPPPERDPALGRPFLGEQDDLPLWVRPHPAVDASCEPIARNA